MIRKKIDKIDWKQELMDKDTDEAYSLFYDKIQTTLHDISPLKTISIKPQKILQQPWMTPGLQKCQQKQYMLYKQSINKRENISAEMKYKTYRNKLKEIMRRTKEKYYRDKCFEYKQNTKKLWKMINRITQKEVDKTNTIEYIKVENLNYYDSKAVSEEFAKHFSQVGKEYTKKNIQTQQRHKALLETDTRKCKNYVHDTNNQI